MHWQARNWRGESGTFNARVRPSSGTAKGRQMKTLIVKTGREAEFFARGRKLAALADGAQPLPHERVISFEDPVELLKLLTAARLELFRSVKAQAGSISEIAQRLGRDRRSVQRDVAELERAGLLTVDPGPGRARQVYVTAQRFKLEALMD